MQPGRHDADNRMGHAVDADGLPEHVAVAGKSAHPQVVAEDRDLVLPRDVFVRGKAPAERRVDAKHAEQRRRGDEAAHAFRLGGAGQARGQRVEASDILEDVILLSPHLYRIGHDNGSLRETRRHLRVDTLHVAVDLPFLPDDRQPAGIGIRQRLQQDGVDHAEHRARGADAQGDGGDGREGEGRHPNEAANR